MNIVQIFALRESAEKAYPKKWRHNKDNEQIGDVSADDSDHSVASAQAYQGCPWQQRDLNAAFIAQADPHTVIQLVDDLQHAYVALQSISEMLKRTHGNAADLASVAKRANDALAQLNKNATPT